jgi:hypothetical protein
VLLPLLGVVAFRFSSSHMCSWVFLGFREEQRPPPSCRASPPFHRGSGFQDWLQPSSALHSHSRGRRWANSLGWPQNRAHHPASQSQRLDAQLMNGWIACSHLFSALVCLKSK